MRGILVSVVCLMISINPSFAEYEVRYPESYIEEVLDSGKAPKPKNDIKYPEKSAIHSTELGQHKALLFQCIKDKLGEKRGTEVEIKLLSKPLVEKLNEIIDVAREAYCQQNKEEDAKPFVVRNSEKAIEDLLNPREFVILLQCKRKTSFAYYDFDPCYYE